MRFSASHAVLSLVAVLGLGACSYHEDKARAQPLNNDLNFAAVKQQIFLPQCARCHGPGAPLDTTNFESVKSNLSKIGRRVLVDKDMPQSGPLAAPLADYLRAWIEAGAPQGKPDPVPSSLEPLRPTYASIHSRILRPMCLSCHAPDGSAKTIVLEPLQDVLSSPMDIVIPGDPQNSSFFVAVTRNDKKRMPPPDSGMRPLSREELEIVREWIAGGAPP